MQFEESQGVGHLRASGPIHRASFDPEVKQHPSFSLRKWVLTKITTDKSGSEIGFAKSSDDGQIAFLPPSSMKALRRSESQVRERMVLKGGFSIKENNKGKILLFSSSPPREHHHESWQVGEYQVYLPDTKSGSDHGDLSFACGQCGKDIIEKGQIFRIHRGAVWTNCKLQLQIGSRELWNEAKQTNFRILHCPECDKNLGALYSEKYAGGSEPSQPFPCCKLNIVVDDKRSGKHNSLVMQSSSRIEAERLVASLDKVEGGYNGGEAANQRTHNLYESRDKAEKYLQEAKRTQKLLDEQAKIAEQSRQRESELEEKKRRAEQEAERLRLEAKRIEEDMENAGMTMDISWECQVDNSWLPYSDEISKRIEDAYAAKAGPINVYINGAEYLINVDLMFQLRKNTNTSRQIRRQKRPTLKAAKEVAIWECNLSDDASTEDWCRYPSDIIKIIENAQIEKVPFIRFTMMKADYFIDFKSLPLEQVRESTQKRRMIRRRIDTIQKESFKQQQQHDWTTEPKMTASDTKCYTIRKTDNPASVSRESDEFNKAGAQYAKMLNSSNFPHRVDYYESETTYRNFQSKKAEFAKGGIPTEEIWVFHGTSSDEDIEKIMSEGFKVGGQDGIRIRNGSAHGNGVYTATGPRAPQTYAGRTNKVILAKGLVGTKGLHSRTPRDDWYIFVEGHQLLPVYVLHM